MYAVMGTIDVRFQQGLGCLGAMLTTTKRELAFTLVTHLT
jgi:hypothetical protein